jgi:hypothetical protein
MPSPSGVAGFSQTGTGVRDFTLQVAGVAFDAPHLLPVGTTVNVLPKSADALQSVIYWGDGTSTSIAGGWRTSTPTSVTSHAYANAGTYRVEYATQTRDGAWDNRTTIVVVGSGNAGVGAPAFGTGCNGGGVRRVLFVGNSQLEVFDVPRIVASLAASAPANCPRIEATTIAIGGANLRDLWNAGRVEPAIRSRAYDTVVIAESIDLIDPSTASYVPAFWTVARTMIDVARASGATPILYATPSTLSSYTGTEFNGMATFNGAMARASGVAVAQGGLAWERVWNESPGTRLHGADNSHANYAGAVLSSLVIYSTILNASPIGLTANPAASCTPSCPVIPEDQAAMFQRLAWQEYMASSRPR